MGNFIKTNKTTIQIFVIIIIAASSLLGYLTWYVSPDHITEKVKVIRNTENGCIVETIDNFAINIGPCNAQYGEIIIATYDAKLKHRALLMNPSG